MKLALPVLALLLHYGVAQAACPPPEDHSEELEALFDEARAAGNDMQGRDVAARMWQVWLRAPDEAAQEVLNRGLTRRNSYDYAGAYADFDRLTEYCPDYAEGYNQRAFISYLREDYAAALIDLDKALDLSPTHVPAQSGRALTLMRLGRIPEARTQLRAALRNNPWLSERFLLSEGGPLAPNGEDI
ncbi:tetratricopeptide repeat protein [Sulfitobacter sp. D35]|uniref:tetratricopeptide repeat protein n=1 Tax=Sulfitobacter sp. D35 TaxID=3083252 RepID=UPI00296EA4B3|nr:tetratricopeptide repeat protein [Sulfitobacter sp. D35]MDW4496638.1 tetratricopeptide repeat protein [Sulfitobacter sp. D35]